MRYPKFVHLVLVSLLLTPTSWALAGPRERLLMDFGWRFKLADPPEVAKQLDYPEASDLAKVRKADMASEPERAASRIDAAVAHLGEDLPPVKARFDDSSWRQLDLPHDWAIELPFEAKANVQHGFKDIDPAKGTSIGWYRRSFDLPASDKGKSLSIEFDGVFRNSLVWLNGRCLGRHPSGYTSFVYDISSVANFGGANTLVVRVDASRVEGWFYEGAGIYRHVWLVKTSPLRVDHWGTFVSSKISGADAQLTIQTDLRNDGAAVGAVELTSEIIDAGGNPVAQLNTGGLSVAAGELKNVEQRIAFKDAHLWSPESPYLYKLMTTVKTGGAVADVYETPFGVRTVRFDANQGFLLNEQHVLIKGTCNHHDHAGVGSALPDGLQSFRVEKLKEMGSNAYRTSHNPPTPELLDACDRMGMMVMDETRRMGRDPEAMGQLESLIRRDRNHPSVIMWSIGNEEGRDGVQGSDEVGVPICTAMQDLAHRLDPTRLCTVAMNGAWGIGFSKVIDVTGYNYVTRGAKSGGMSVDDFRKNFPEKLVVGTEDASTVCTRGIYADDATAGYVSAYDKRGIASAEKWWTFYGARPYLPGSFVWTGFDYRGEPTPYKWPCISSHFGIYDTCGFPKDNFYYYQAWWGDRPVLHLFPHWNWAGKEGQPIDVWVHSNLPEVELFLNGASLGRRKMTPRSHLQWKVNYTPGVLEARGYQSGSGEAVKFAQVRTTAAAAKLVVSATRKEINADGEDMAVIKVAVGDPQCDVVPTASNLVKFEVVGDGKIIGVGNGDPSCHEPDKATQRSAFNGLCMAIVQAGRQAGDITVTAKAEGLEAGSVVIHAKPATPRPFVAPVR